MAVAAAIATVSIGGCGGAEPAQSRDSRPAPGGYAGRTSQGLPVTVIVAADRRTLALDIRWRCTSPRDPSAGSVRAFRQRPAAIARDGTFSATGRRIGRPGSDTRETARVTGRTSARGALTGTWSGEYEYVTDDTDIRCASGDVTFDLRRRRSAPGVQAKRDPVVALDGPREVAVAAGQVWVLEQGQTGPAVVAIDPATGAPLRRTLVGGIDAAVAPPGVAFPPVLAAGEGAAWVVTGILGPRLELTRVDAKTGGRRRITVAPPAPGPGPGTGTGPGTGPGTGSGIGVAAFGSLAVGEGAVWMLVGEHVLRLDRRSGRLVRTIRLTPAPPADSQSHCGLGAGRGSAPPGLQADRLAIGAGAVWVASKCGPRPSRLGFLSRIDPDTNRVTRAVALRHSYSTLAAGAAGVWAATATSTLLTPRAMKPALHRIDPRTGRPAAVTPLRAGEVRGLAVGRDSVWVARTADARAGAGAGAGAPVGSLGRLDADRARLSTVLRLEAPSSLAVGGGRVWVVDAFARTLRRAAAR